MSDISQGFRPADILGVPQAIKGFDKSDFCEVFSMYLHVGDIGVLESYVANLIMFCDLIPR